jgi:hypothetical protein
MIFCQVDGQELKPALLDKDILEGIFHLPFALYRAELAAREMIGMIKIVRWGIVLTSLNSPFLEPIP